MARAIAGRGAARRPPQAKVVRSRGGQCGAGRRGERSARRPPQAKVVRSRGGQCGAGRRGERCCSPPASLMLLISHLDSAVDQVTCARLTDMYESASVQRHCRNGQPDPRKWSRTTALQTWLPREPEKNFAYSGRWLTLLVDYTSSTSGPTSAFVDTARLGMLR
ncbi:uncharacterized protein [Procambarus clarkii]|uniref:uncharacterized protein isoform X2 n=1 Tax=Procambarus clarkii TaxID=6728 RepID=UPI0037421ECE